jgi:hypothetical protein
MLLRRSACGLAIALIGCSGPLASTQDTDAIKKLGFLAGSWHCIIVGAKVPAGDVEHLTYEFAPDWSWMVERSNLIENGHTYWATQLWGYDPSQKKLVAYQFTSKGIFTKTVTGWKADRFVSKRDYDGASVIMRAQSENAFQWIIEGGDYSQAVTEACKRDRISSKPR